MLPAWPAASSFSADSGMPGTGLPTPSTTQGRMARSPAPQPGFPSGPDLQGWPPVTRQLGSAWGGAGLPLTILNLGDDTPMQEPPSFLCKAGGQSQLRGPC